MKEQKKCHHTPQFAGHKTFNSTSLNNVHNTPSIASFRWARSWLWPWPWITPPSSVVPVSISENIKWFPISTQEMTKKYKARTRSDAGYRLCRPWSWTQSHVKSQFDSFYKSSLYSDFDQSDSKSIENLTRFLDETRSRCF